MEMISGDDGKKTFWDKNKFKPQISLDTSSSLKIMRGIIDGVNCLHEKFKRYHFDLKPGNYMLEFQTLTPKIIDIDGTLTVEEVRKVLKENHFFPYTGKYEAVSIKDQATFESNHDFLEVGSKKFKTEDDIVNKFLLRWDDWQVGKVLCEFVRNLLLMKPAPPVKITKQPTKPIGDSQEDEEATLLVSKIRRIKFLEQVRFSEYYPDEKCNAAALGESNAFFDKGKMASIQKVIDGLMEGDEARRLTLKEALAAMPQE